MITFSFFGGINAYSGIKTAQIFSESMLENLCRFDPLSKF